MDHTIALIRKSHDGDEKARAQIVEENVGLIWCVVRRFLGRGVESEDLFQIGSIGLLKAIDKFDFAYDVKFSTYAVPMISGEIQRFLRDDGIIKVSRSLKELAYKAFQAKEIMQERLQRDPTLEELAGYMKVEKEELVIVEGGGQLDGFNGKVGGFLIQPLLLLGCGNGGLQLRFRTGVGLLDGSGNGADDEDQDQQTRHTNDPKGQLCLFEFLQLAAFSATGVNEFLFRIRIIFHRYPAFLGINLVSVYYYTRNLPECKNFYFQSGTLDFFAVLGYD